MLSKERAKVPPTEHDQEEKASISYQARLNGALTCKQEQVSLSGLVLTTRPQPSLEVDRANSSEFNLERGTQGTYFKIHQIC